VSDQPAPLLNVKEHEDFLGDKRDVEAAEIYARRFAQAETADEPADALMSLKDVVKAAEAHKLAITQPHRDTTKHVNDEYKELVAKPKAAIEVLTKRALATKRVEEVRVAEQERERKEELERLAEEEAERAQKAAEEAEAKPDDVEAQRKAAEANRSAGEATVKASDPKAGALAKPKQLRGSLASLGGAVTYKWDVVDLEALPDSLKTFDKKAIDEKVRVEKAVAKAEGRDFNLQLIDGVRIWTEERGVSRRRAA
jgi:flagellar biosynthesis GTPase FlhF